MKRNLDLNPTWNIANITSEVSDMTIGNILSYLSDSNLTKCKPLSHLSIDTLLPELSDKAMTNLTICYQLPHMTLGNIMSEFSD